MLSHERYGHARAGLTAMVQNEVIASADEANKQTLLNEQYTTQLALESLGVSLSTPPAQIPRSNEIVLSENEPNLTKPVSVSLIGPPNVGKTTTLNTIVNSMGRVSDRPLVQDELYRQEKKLMKEKGTFNYFDLMFAVAVKQRVSYWSAIAEFYEHWEKEPYYESLLLGDRLVWTDLPMLRAHFLFGRLDEASFLILEEVFLGMMVTNTATNNAIIECLIAPDESLRRQNPDEGPGPITNLPFLQVLYEQYLRFHYEMLNFERVYGKPRPFAFATVDMSSSNRWRNFRRLDKTINWMHIYLATPKGERDAFTAFKDMTDTDEGLF